MDLSPALAADLAVLSAATQDSAATIPDSGGGLEALLESFAADLRKAP